jgi:Flp pilus assembly protein TadD
MDSMQESGMFLPRQLDLLNLLGYQHLQHGNAHRAVVIFDALHALTPGNTKVILSLAYACLQAGEPDKALNVMEDLPKSDVHDALACLIKGKALLQTGRVAESARAMRLFIQKRHAGQA